MARNKFRCPHCGGKQGLRHLLGAGSQDLSCPHCQSKYKRKHRHLDSLFILLVTLSACIGCVVMRAYLGYSLSQMLCYTLAYYMLMTSIYLVALWYYEVLE